jgi:hypothetical protein
MVMSSAKFDCVVFSDAGCEGLEIFPENGKLDCTLRMFQLVPTT